MSDKKYQIEALDTSKHRRQDFACESEELNKFLKNSAKMQMKARASACYVLTEQTDPGFIVGFYTLSQAIIHVAKLPEDIAKKLPKYPELGATLIGRLARDLTFKGQGIGEILIMDAITRSLRFASQVGAVAIITDPKDEKAADFYKRFGFQKLPNEQRMFVPMSHAAVWEKQV